MSVDLRIPVTPGQKRLIEAASQVNPEGMAAWARNILIREANKQLAEQSAEKPVQRRKT